MLRRHACCLSIPGPGDPGTALLSAEEKARWRNYLRDADHELFGRVHTSLRQTLSRYGAVDPARWTFHTNRFGRPEITNPGAPPGLRFNLSHTHAGARSSGGVGGALAIVVNRGFDAGVDIETLNRVADLERMARTCFSESERDLLSSQPPEDRQRWFTRTWTLKEAFIKAKGMGLALPLKAFSFDPTDRAAIGFSCDREVDAQMDDWTFTLREPTPTRIVATAAKRSDGAPDLAVFTTEPTDSVHFCP